MSRKKKSESVAVHLEGDVQIMAHPKKDKGVLRTRAKDGRNYWRMTRYDGVVDGKVQRPTIGSGWAHAHELVALAQRLSQPEPEPEPEAAERPEAAQPPPEPQRVTRTSLKEGNISTLLQAWLAAREREPDRAKRTRELNIGAALFIDEIIGTRPVAAGNRAQTITDLRVTLRAKDGWAGIDEDGQPVHREQKAVSTSREILKVWRQVWRWAQGAGIVAEGIDLREAMRALKRAEKRADSGIRRKRLPTAEDVEAVCRWFQGTTVKVRKDGRKLTLKNAPTWSLRALTLVRWTGCRVEETSFVRWSGVRLEPGAETGIVRFEWMEERTEGLKTGERDCVLDAQEIQEILALRRPEDRDGDLVIGSAAGTVQNLSRPVRDACAALKGVEAFTPKDVRMLRANEYRRSEVRAEAAAANMGHDPITVIRWYADLAKMDRTDAAIQVADAARARRGDRRPAPAESGLASGGSVVQGPWGKTGSQ